MSENGSAEAPRPRVVKLADQLDAEIRTRKLKPGDRFLTALQAIAVGPSGPQPALSNALVLEF